MDDYRGSSKTITLEKDPGIFTMAAGDNVSILPPNPLMSNRTEPGRETPGVSITPVEKLDFLYKWARNKSDVNSTEKQFYADGGSTVDQQRTAADSAGVYTEEEMTSGP